MECRLVILGMVAVVFTLLPLSEAAGKPGKVVCYYAAWAANRPGDGKCTIEDLDPRLCTHMIYSFVGLDPTTHEVKLLDPAQEPGSFQRFTKLGTKGKPKKMVAIGGWNEGAAGFSKMAADPAARKKFIASVVRFLQTYGFDGFDIDWEYPASATRGGAPQDKQNFVHLVREMKAEFKKHRPPYLLSAAVGAGKKTVESAYDLPALSKDLDFINVMTYDFHQCGEPVTGHHAPLYSHPRDKGEEKDLNVNSAILNFIHKGVPRDKLIMGVGSYGQSFTLANPANHGIGAPASKPGQAGPFTKQAGMLGFTEICQKVKKEHWKVVTDENTKTPYAFHGDQWVGYDSQMSIRRKSVYAKTMRLGGVMMWSMDTDDCHGACSTPKKKFPLLKAVNSVIGGKTNQ